MRPLEVFTSGRNRAELLVDLYQHLHNLRHRGIRADWAASFRRIMHWPQDTPLERVDGHGSILILHPPATLHEGHFESHALSELLRAAVAGIVGALDRYVHELVMTKLLGTLRNGGADARKRLTRLSVPLPDVANALAHGREPGARPMNMIKRALQDSIHRETYQDPDRIAEVLNLIGVQGLWAACAQAMHVAPEEIKNRLRRIVAHRNRIVHEGDIERRLRGGRLRLFPIAEAEVRGDIAWLADLVNAIDHHVM